MPYLPGSNVLLVALLCCCSIWLHTANAQCNCQNGGTCINGTRCPNNASSCCVCLVDFVGDNCQAKRMASMLLSLKTNVTFTPDLTNPANPAYLNLANQIIRILRVGMDNFFSANGTSTTLLNIRVINYVNGPNGRVFPTISMDLAPSTNASLITPNASDILNALNFSCVNNTVQCSSIGLDIGFVNLTVNPNVCNNPATSVCSPNARCEFNSVTNYTCSCNPGYRDDSSSDAGGVLCTRVCSANSCATGGNCTERVGGEFTCSYNVPAGQCPPNYCQNGGTCRTGSNCPGNAQFCCLCAPEYVGDTCEGRRIATMFHSFKSNMSFQPEHYNPNSQGFMNIFNQLIPVVKAAFSNFFTANGFTNVAFSIKILNINPATGGGIFINTSTDLAVPNGLTPPSLSAQDLATYMAGACSSTNGTCTALGLDLSYALVIASPNLCLSSSTNLCSPNSVCTFISGINYTCQCLPGFRDDSNATNSTRSGVRCTRPCAANNCPGGTCNETVGGDYKCSFPPGQCPDSYCGLGGRCRLAPRCPNNATICCVCKPDFVGDTCQSRRQASAVQVLKSNKVFTDSLLNPNSSDYIQMEAQFVAIMQAAMMNFYASKNINNPLLSIRVISFSSGSVMAQMNTDAATASGTGSLPAPSSSDMTTALASACSSGSTCASMSLDTTYASVTANPNLCSSSTTNTCSANATCTFYGGVNYTCTCKSGFRDDGNGATCTRICSTTICNGYGCTERTGADVLCSCPSGVTNPYCGSLRLQQSLIFLIVSLLVFPLAIHIPIN